MKAKVWVLIWRGFWGKNKYEGMDEEGCRVFSDKRAALAAARKMPDGGDVNDAVRELDEMGGCAFPDGERLNLWESELE